MLLVPYRSTNRFSYERRGRLASGWRVTHLQSLNTAVKVIFSPRLVRCIAFASAPLAMHAPPELRDELPPAVAREFRAAWVTPLTAGTAPDWPSRAGLHADSQRAELRALLDRARDIGLNAIVLHVRTSGDALYPTPHAPWSAFLSGRSGAPPEPYYDPLEFAIREAHARGLQLHAWFNPYRAILPNIKGSAAPTHVTRAQPSWIRTYGSQTWIDPGEPAARAAILATILDVVERYDVDGIHIDDYFYPYREQHTVTKVVGGRRVTVREDIPFPDNVTWARYGAPNGYATRADWRRSNVDGLVQDLYAGVKARKPWVAVGISPFGIWRSGTPAGITGLDAYGEIYADSRKWLREGWMDYMAPQLYWPMDGVQRRFAALDQWWRTQNPHGRHIWPGLYTLGAVAPRAPWAANEIPSQIAHVRSERDGTDDAPGHVHFRIGALTRADWLGGRLRESLYDRPALIPAMPWLGGARPASPVPEVRDGSLRVTPGDTVPVAWWLIQSLSSSGRWTSAVRSASGDQTSIPLHGLGDLGGGRIAITAIDRVGQESGLAVLDVGSGDWDQVSYR